MSDKVIIPSKLWAVHRPSLDDFETSFIVTDSGKTAGVLFTSEDLARKYCEERDAGHLPFCLPEPADAVRFLESLSKAGIILVALDPGKITMQLLQIKDVIHELKRYPT